MNSLERHRDQLNQLIKAREAVKKKYNSIKRNDETFEKIISDTFKPITKPLHKLVDLTTDDNDADFDKDRSIKRSKSVLLDIKKKENEEDNSTANNAIEKLDVAAGSNDDANETLLPLQVSKSDPSEHGDMGHLRLYLAILESGRDLNNILDPTGVKKGSGNNSYQLKFGNSDISFRDKFIVLDEKHKYSITPGLVELLFKRDPIGTYVTNTDLANFRNILQYTSAHRVKNDPNSRVKAWNQPKYTKYIHPLFNVKIGGGALVEKSLPGLWDNFKVAYLKPKKYYRYWNDPNELCERLKLLLGEKNAGNSSHDNEINSIIEELREEGYIR
ncbi:hypothetical protein TKK_0014839 [Trichogramma kaykai]